MTNSPTPSPVTIAPKPCPFCGSTPKLSGGGMFYACPNIHCTIHDYAVELEDWNRRSSAGEDVKASPVVPVSELETLIENAELYEIGTGHQRAIPIVRLRKIISMYLSSRS